MIQKILIIVLILFNVLLGGWLLYPSSIFLPSDIFIYLLINCVLFFLIWASKKEYYQDIGKQILKQKISQISLVVICIYFVITLLDSFHYQPKYYHESSKKEINNSIRSVLDMALAEYYPGVKYNGHHIDANFEKSYSKPFATHLFAENIEWNPDTKKMELGSEKLQAPNAHWLGTDKAGGDIFYKILKGTRTAIVVGLVTTLIAVPFAMLFGISAGYFGGKIDDIIQFIYTTISSIPGILLITSLVLIVNTLLKSNSATQIIIREDAMLLGLCFILGILGWSGLCRLLRAETLKIKELDFINAARTLGSSHFKIIYAHIVPNVMHIILISFILQFSGLVMVEAILSYLRIGVPSTIGSWGRIIDEARNELSRDPIIAWPLLSSFFAMFILILFVNLLGDVVRDALDPKLRKGK